MPNCWDTKPNTPLRKMQIDELKAINPEELVGIIKKNNITVTFRRSRGKDIDAAVSLLNIISEINSFRGEYPVAKVTYKKEGAPVVVTLNAIFLCIFRIHFE